MLWYKSWLETRWQFLTGLIVLFCAAADVVVFWPKVLQLMPLASSIDAGGEIGRQIKEGAELVRDYRGYIWSQGFRQSLSNMATLFAVLLGAGGLLSQRAGGLFLLSLPVSRGRFLAVRAATGLAELLALTFVPSLVILLLSPSVGKTYSVVDALIHGTCLFFAAAAFFSLTLLLSTVFGDYWRPLLITLLVAIILGFAEQALRDQWSSGIFHVMSGEAYFRHGELPWLGLLASLAASSAMLYGATIKIARQDF
ncbi:MAG TPA: hypothetical protein VMH05_25140 [Bryobacteraceae bacterium]|nr:hypothetical protein [Bryobacteraceae bacterium]